MEIVSMIAAAVAAYVFGSVWYMVLSRPWMKASGLSASDINRKNPVPFIIAFVCVLFVAVMMRYLFAQLVIMDPVSGLLAGLAIGLFIVVPWIATNYTFARRPRALILIDGTYAAVGCGIIGVVLSLF